VDNGAKVINMSLGGPSNPITFQNAVAYAINNNVVVVASMMNDNSNTVYYPAAYPGVIAVGSTDPDDTRSAPFFWDPSSGSNYGSHISVVAPGNYIYGIWYQSNTSYGAYYGGTSQAAPHVSGLAALLLAQDPNRTPAQIKSIIETTAEDQTGDPIEDTPGWDQYYGYGRINAFNALSVTTNTNSLYAQNKIFSVFPNPADRDFTINFPSTTKQIQIFNSVGKSLEVRNVAEQTAQNFQLVENGIYFIQITTDTQTITKKLVISR